VLKIIQDSEAAVLPGPPLVDIGSPLNLEIVADLLSNAVQVKVGAPVRIDGWGGPPVRGKGVRSDPAGFLKVSALGIEEQRIDRFRGSAGNVVATRARLSCRRPRDHLERHRCIDHPGECLVPEE
jgi:hypothetical protein